MKSEMLARVRAAIAIVLRQKGYVSVLDVLVEMKRLTPARLEDWRFGRVPYLERVIEGNLSKLSLIGQEVRNVAQAHGLTPRVTFQRRWGGAKRALRFSKSGDSSVELAYATQWVSERGGARRPLDRGTEGVPPLGDGGTTPADEAGKAPSAERPQSILQPGVPVVRDPDRVSQLAAGKSDENSDLRAFLKWEGPPPQLVDRLFHRLQAEVSAEIDCTECARCCRELSPLLKAKDVERLARRLRVPIPEFRRAHLREDDEGFVFADALSTPRRDPMLLPPGPAGGLPLLSSPAQEGHDEATPGRSRERGRLPHRVHRARAPQGGAPRARPRLAGWLHDLLSCLVRAVSGPGTAIGIGSCGEWEHRPA